MKIIQHINAKRLDVKNIKNNELEILFWDRNTISEDLKRAAELQKEYNIKFVAVHLPNYHINKENSEMETLSLIEIIEKLQILSPKIVNMHCLYGGVEEMVKNLCPVLSSLPDRITFTIENMTKSKANIHDVESAKSFVNLIKKFEFINFGLCFDITHLSVKNEKSHTNDVLNYIEELKDFIKHIHISDVKKENGSFSKHQLIGTGIINWKIVKEKLIEIKYDGFLTIEYLPEYEDKFFESLELWEKL
jgi:sugar phosphate isomerase/epimerase